MIDNDYGKFVSRLTWGIFCQIILAVVFLGQGVAVSADTTSGEWVDVSATATANISNPIRSRRDPNARVDVTLQNTGAEDIKGPVRLVLADLTSEVSLANASGTTAEGHPYILMLATQDNVLAPGQTSEVISLSITNGGTVNFTFTPQLEQHRPAQAEALKVKITEPASLLTLGHTPLLIKGTINQPNAELVVNGISVPHANGVFEAQVALIEGYNTIVAGASNAGGEQVTDSIIVSLDLTPPYITIESHTDGQTVSTDKVTVTGLVNDIVRGTVEEHQANVRVNGITAAVSNRSYSAIDVPLVEGANVITVTGSDQVGNTDSTSITLNYNKPAGKRIELVSGQNQAADIEAVLAAPLVVKVSEDNGDPAPGVPVVFRVVQGSGVVAVGTDKEGRAVVLETDAQGQASTGFRLGQRSGVSNQKVRAVVVGYEGEVIFNASARAKIGNKLSVNSGNNQRAAVGQSLPAPFVTVVTDNGANVVQGARVRFEVTRGGGVFQNGLASYETATDSDGRATAQLTLGELEGLDAQRVTATLIDSPEGQVITAGFTATAFISGDAGNTTISGVILDNQDQPIPGITVHIEGTTRKAITDEQGRFVITSAPVGPVHLVADGSTATVPGEFPSLGYRLVTIAGVDNPLSAPIYMVKLNTEEAVYAGNAAVELTLDKFPGFKLEIAPNSVTFPDGSREGHISVTSVNASAVPMAPPNGMQPQFIVTIQPTGTLFDPPARLSLPNVDGHVPGAQVEMYSYDHDLEEFVAIGLGTVSEDGSVIRSNPGVGVVKAGWHCGSQPAGAGCCEGSSDCGHCYNKVGNCPSSCEFVPNRQAENQIEGNCRTELCSGSEPNDGDKPPEECGTCKDGAPVIDEEKPLNADKQKPDDCKELLCGGGSNPKDETAELKKKEANQCKKCGNGEIVNEDDKTACGNGTDAELCYTCKDGSCGNHCEASNSTHTVESTAPDFVIKALTEFPDALKPVPWFKAELEPFIGVQMTSGEHCCKDCSTPEPQSYQKFTGNAGVKGVIKVSWPGLGGNFELPEKVFAGYAIKGEIFVSLVGAVITIDAKGEVNYTDTKCPDEDCGNFNLGANLNGTFGPQIDGSAKFVSCSTLDCKGEDVTIFAVTGKGGGTLNVTGFLGGQYSSGAQCGKSCLGGRLDPVTFAAHFSIGIEILFKKYTYSASMDPIQLYAGTSFGPGC